MDLNSLAVFRVAKAQMDWVSQDQKLVAENIANANTPEYRPKELRKQDFRRLTLDAYSAVPEQAVTQEGHVQAALPDHGPYRELRGRHTYETSIDGNRVVVEEQVERMSRNRSSYTLALSLIKKNMQMIKTALGQNSG